MREILSAIPLLKHSPDYYMAIQEASEEKNAFMIDALHRGELPRVSSNRGSKDYIVRILEIGPGSGQSLRALHGLMKEGEKKSVYVTAVDIFPRTEIEAQKLHLNWLKRHADIASGMAQNLPLTKESISGVNVSAVFHEIYSYGGGLPAVRQTLREIARILAPRGIFCYRDPLAPDENFMNESEQLYKNATWVAFLQHFLPEFVQSGIAPYKDAWKHIAFYQFIEGSQRQVQWRGIKNNLPLRVVAPVGLQREIQRHYLTLREYLIRTGALGMQMEEPHWKHPLYENKPVIVRPGQNDKLARQLLSDIGKNIDSGQRYEIEGSLSFDQAIDILMYRFFNEISSGNVRATHIFSNWMKREGAEYYSYLGLTDFLAFAAETSIEQTRGEYVLAPSSPHDIHVVPRNSYQVYLETVLTKPFLEGKLVVKLTKHLKRDFSEAYSRFQVASASA